MRRGAIAFLKDESGQDLVEYALLMAGIALAVIATINQMTAGIATLYTGMTDKILEIGNLPDLVQFER